MAEFCSDGWPFDECDCDALDQLPEERRDQIIELAAYLLWGKTGKRFGVCAATVRPCDDPRVLCGRCGDGFAGPPLCCCRVPGEITLPGPIDSIIEVVIDGETVDPATYRVDDRYWLVNLVEAWPRCPDLVDEGFVISYYRGQPVPAGAGIAVAEFACEMAKAICAPTECRLPKRMTSKVRQGVTVNYDDYSTTGIYVIDAWVDAANAPSLRPRVHSPDLPRRPRETTWGPGGSP